MNWLKLEQFCLGLEPEPVYLADIVLKDTVPWKSCRGIHKEPTNPIVHAELFVKRQFYYNQLVTI